MPRGEDATGRPDEKPSVVVRRRVEWSDTDAAGHHHHSVVIRWVEAAEGVLLARLGLEHLWGSVPRVRYEVDYKRRLWHGQEVEVHLSVGKLGTTSLRYDFEVLDDAGGVAAAGSMWAAYAPPDSDRAVPWCAQVREALDGR